MARPYLFIASACILVRTVRMFGAADTLKMCMMKNADIFYGLYYMR